MWNFRSAVYSTYILIPIHSSFKTTFRWYRVLYGKIAVAEDVAAFLHTLVRKYRLKEEKEMKRKSMLALLLAVSMTCSMTAATGAVAYASDDTATEESADDADTTDDAAAEDTADDADAADTEEASDDDQKAADEVAALIDKIYVQERNDTTDEDCKAAKEAWDKLTDAQKELV